MTLNSLKIKNKRRIGWFLVVVVVPLYLYSRYQPSVDIPISNEYGYFSATRDNHVITRNGLVIVEADVKWYEMTSDGYLVGKRSETKYPDSYDSYRKQRFGYFAIDIKSGELLHGLSKPQLEHIIDKYDIQLKSKL